MYGRVRISARRIPEKTLHEAIKLKWGPLGVGEARTVRHPPRKASGTEWS